MKGYRTLLSIIILVSGIVGTAFGDGVAFSGRDYSSMRPIKQGEQRAVIIHRNGVEKMLIAVSLELEDEDKGIWIFPVPGNPNTIKLDVLDSFPIFKGVEPWREAENLFGNVAGFVLATQIYPLPIVVMGELSFKGSSGAIDIINIIKHCEVEKWGIHAEAISVSSIWDLPGYLKEKGVGIETEDLIAFEGYLSDKYVLILAWISSRQELLKEFKEYGKKYPKQTKERWPCLYVEFATDKAFYPMRPTRSYGNEFIKIDLTILDYVQIDETHPPRHTKYYRQRKAVENVPSKMAQDLSSANMRYTKVSFYDAAENLSEDLWFIPGVPKEVKNAELITAILGNPFVFCVVAVCPILIFSWISGGLTGLVLFQRWKGYAHLGLWNILTIVGLCIASYKVKGIVGERFSQTDRFPGRWTFNVLFSIFYLVIAGYLLSILGEASEHFIR